MRSIPMKYAVDATLLVVAIACFFSVALWNWSAEGRGRILQATHDVNTIYEGALIFRRKTGRWPDSVHEIARLLYDPSNRSFVSVPKSPWGYPYEIVGGEGEFAVICLGRDNAHGGVGEDADIVSEVAPHR